MQNVLFQHETLGLHLVKTAHLFDKENAYLKKMLPYPSNKASLYQRHFSRVLILTLSLIPLMYL